MNKFAIAIIAMCFVGIAGAGTISIPLTEDFTTSEIVDSGFGGYKSVVHPELEVPVEPVGAPLLPMKSMNITLPRNAIQIDFSVDAEWEVIATDITLQPIQEPVRMSQPIPAAFTAADPKLYAEQWPKQVVETLGVRSAAGEKVLPIRITPFRYANGTLEAAKNLKVTVTFALPKFAGTDVFKYKKTDPNHPDYVMIAPNRYYGKWVNYIAERQKDHPELVYKLVNLKDILAKYPINTEDPEKGYYARNEAEQLHAYIREMARQGTRYFVLAGAFYGANEHKPGTKKLLSLYDPEWGVQPITSENGIPGVYTWPRTADNDVNDYSMPIPSDTFYACTDIPEGVMYPWDAGRKDSKVNVYDPKGNGLYLDECDTYEDRSVIDLMPDVVVTRISFKMNSKYWSVKPRYQELVDAYLAKVRKVENPSFDGRHKYVGVTDKLSGFGSYATLPSDMRRETEFYTGSYNMFDTHRSSTWADSEPWTTRLIRDRFSKEQANVYAEFTSVGNWPVGKNSLDEGLLSYRDKNWECMIVDSHGTQSGIPFVGNDVSSVMKGYIKIFTALVPCLTGYPDWDIPSISGNTVDSSHAEILIENWQGGAAFSMGSTREGWYANPNPDIYNGDGFQSTLQNKWTIGYFDHHMMPGDAFLYMLQNYNRQYGGPSSTRWTWTVAIAYGDPVIGNYPSDDYVWSGAARGELAWNLVDAGLWMTNGVPTVYNHANSVEMNLDGSSAITITDTIAAMRLNVAQPSDATLTLKGDGKLRLSRELNISGGNFVTKIGGGVGHEGFKFTEEKGNIRLESLEKFYLAKIANVDTMTLAGANALLDFRKDGDDNWLDFDNLVFAGSNRAVNQGNTLRSDVEGALTKYLPLTIADMGVRLETFNAFKNATTDMRLFELTNADLTVGTNPNIGLAESKNYEKIFGSVSITDSTITADRTTTLHFGELSGSEFVVNVSGNCAVKSVNDGVINLYGKTIFDLAAGSALLLDAEFANGDNGSIEFRGQGSVKVVNAKSLTRNVVVGAGVTIEFTQLPLQTVESLIFEDGSTVVLPPSDSGTYQLIPIMGATLTVNGTVHFSVRGKDGSITPFSCKSSTNGMLFSEGQVLTWNCVSGNWSKNTEDTPWSGAPFVEGRGVYFGDVENSNAAIVNVVGTPSAGFGAFGNGKTDYTFGSTDADSMAIFNSINIGGKATFDLPVYADGAVHVMSGITEFKSENTSANALNTKGVVVYDGATFGATTMKRELNRIKYIRIYMKSPKYEGADRIRLEEFSIARDGNVIPWNSLGPSVSGNRAEGVSYENLDRLVNGDWSSRNDTVSEAYRSQIIASRSLFNAGNVFVTISFPKAIEMFDAYSFYVSKYTIASNKSVVDDYYLNTWDIDVSLDGVSWVRVSSASYAHTGSSGGWYGNDRQRYRVSFEDKASLEVLPGGKLLAYGALETDVTFEEGSIIKAVPSKSIDYSKFLKVSYPSGKIKIDVSDLVLSDIPQTIIKNAGYDFGDLYHFEIDGEAEASLRIVDGDLAVVKSDGIHGPYTRTLNAEGTWNADNWFHYLGSDDEETGLPHVKQFTKKWSETVLDWATDVRVDFAEGVSTAQLTLDCDVKCDTFGAHSTNNVRAVDFTIKSVNDKMIDAQTIDLSEFPGTTTFEPDCGSAHVIAGPATRLTGGGAGLLTVPSDATVTLTKPWCGEVEGSGTIILDPNGGDWRSVDPDLKMLKVNTTSTILLGNGTMTIPEETSITVAKLAIGSGAKVITMPTETSWVVKAKNVEVEAGGELIIKTTSENWMNGLDFAKVTGVGSIVYLNESSEPIGDIGSNRPAPTLTMDFRGKFTFTSASEGAIALDAAKIRVSEGSVFTAGKIANNNGQFKYVRISFKNTNYQMQIIEFATYHNGVAQKMNGTVTCAQGGSALNYLIDNPTLTQNDFGYYSLFGANEIAKIPANGTVLITLNEPVKNFTAYQFAIASKAAYPKGWDIEISEDGQTYYLVSSVPDYPTPTGGYNWGSTYYASRTADVTIAKGGTLVAKGYLDANITFEAGAVVRPVRDGSIILSKYSVITFPGTGKVKIDISDLNLTRGESIPFISGHKFTAEEAARFDTGKLGYGVTLAEDGSLKLEYRAPSVPKVLFK